jgi:hypothetical protein
MRMTACIQSSTSPTNVTLLEAGCRIRTKHCTIEGPISVGIAAMQSCEGTTADILKRTDRALYRTNSSAVTGLAPMPRRRSCVVS